MEKIFQNESAVRILNKLFALNDGDGVDLSLQDRPNFEMQRDNRRWIQRAQEVYFL